MEGKGRKPVFASQGGRLPYWYRRVTPRNSGAGTKEPSNKPKVSLDQIVAASQSLFERRNETLAARARQTGAA